MARRSSYAVVAVLVVVALLFVGAHGLTQGSLYTDCVSSFNKLGGKEGISKVRYVCAGALACLRVCLPSGDAGVVIG